MGFDYSRYTGGDFVKFDNVGDEVIGIIKDVREGRDFNGNPCPLLVLEVNETGEEKTLTAGQVMLKAALAEKAPKVGDKVKITYSGMSEAKPGKAPAKLFTIDIKPGPHKLANPTVSVGDESPF